jgi:hypothetical protein
LGRGALKAYNDRQESSSSASATYLRPRPKQIIHPSPSSLQRGHLWYATRNEGQTTFKAMEPDRYGSFDEWLDGSSTRVPESLSRSCGRSRESDGAAKATRPERQALGPVSSCPATSDAVGRVHDLDVSRSIFRSPIASRRVPRTTRPQGRESP